MPLMMIGERVIDEIADERATRDIASQELARTLCGVVESDGPRYNVVVFAERVGEKEKGLCMHRLGAEVAGDKIIVACGVNTYHSRRVFESLERHNYELLRGSVHPNSGYRHLRPQTTLQGF